MAIHRHLTLLLSTLFLTSSMLLHLPTMTVSDNTCPYPCYPPPTGTGTPTPITTTPPPPAAIQYYPPPATGNLPYYYNPPPPFGNNYYYGPPPPDPILPYFPFYYRKPPHGTQSPAASLPRSTILIAGANVFSLAFLFGFSLM